MANKRIKKKKANVNKELAKATKKIINLGKVIDKYYINPKTTKEKEKTKRTKQINFTQKSQNLTKKEVQDKAWDWAEDINNAELWALVKRYHELVDEGFIRSQHFDNYIEEAYYIKHIENKEDLEQLVIEAENKKAELWAKEEERQARLRARRQQEFHGFEW